VSQRGFETLYTSAGTTDRLLSQLESSVDSVLMEVALREPKRRPETVRTLLLRGMGRGGMGLMARARKEPDVVRYADMFSAIGTEPRLRIMRVLLAAHPQGMIAGDIGAELDIPPSTLSHHLDKLNYPRLEAKGFTC
jgi:Helix-turn-helix domain